MPNPFHIAVPVHDLEEAKAFYVDAFNCKLGRTSSSWIDLNLYGHQYVLHLKEGMKVDLHHNDVDGKSVPVPHFGVVLDWEQWENLAARLKSQNHTFIVAPYIRFEGETGEQATLFLLDPSGNALEFKAFKNIDQLFAT